MFMLDLFQEVLDGVKAAVIVYGQSGEGKRNTMMNRRGGGGSRDDAGIIERWLERMVSVIEASPVYMQYTVEISAVELHNEQVTDLNGV